MRALLLWLRRVYPPDWWDIVSPRMIVSLAILGFTVTFSVRPNLHELYPAYSAFDDLMPLRAWAWWALLAALGMLLAPRGSPHQMLAQLASAIFCQLAAGVFAQGIGFNTGSWTYTLLAVVNFVLFGRTVRHWLIARPWFRRLAAHPPRWFPARCREDRDG